MYIHLVAVIFATTLLYGCAEADNLDSGIKFSSAEIQNTLLVELDKAGIKYEIDSDNFVRFQKKHEFIIEALQKQIIDNKYKQYGYIKKIIAQCKYCNAQLKYKGIRTEIDHFKEGQRFNNDSSHSNPSYERIVKIVYRLSDFEN